MTIQITFDKFDLFQVIDALELRAEAWGKTAHYLLTGDAPDDILVEECSNAYEANQIAAHYRSIVANIRSQIR